MVEQEEKGMPFAGPMTWREPTDRTYNCYFCMISPAKRGLSRKKKKSIVYPNILLAIRSVLHRGGLPVSNALTLVSQMRKAVKRMKRRVTVMDCRVTQIMMKHIPLGYIS